MTLSKAEAVGHKKAGPRALMALVVLAALLVLVYWLDQDRFYLWITAAHILAVISWMAGLLYLPRLFINHLGTDARSDASEMLKGMEHRLLKIIMTPAMNLSWVFGIYLAITGGHFSEIWFYVKFFAVVIMSGSHMYMAKSVRLFGADLRPKSQRHWRFVNEVPTVLMIVIVVMVVLKPF